MVLNQVLSVGAVDESLAAKAKRSGVRPLLSLGEPQQIAQRWQHDHPGQPDHDEKSGQRGVRTGGVVNGDLVDQQPRILAHPPAGDHRAHGRRGGKPCRRITSAPQQHEGGQPGERRHDQKRRAMTAQGGGDGVAALNLYADRPGILDDEVEIARLVIARHACEALGAQQRRVGRPRLARRWTTRGRFLCSGLALIRSQPYECSLGSPGNGANPSKSRHAGWPPPRQGTEARTCCRSLVW
jgi:hypothetical protein